MLQACTEMEDSFLKQKLYLDKGAARWLVDSINGNLGTKLSHRLLVLASYELKFVFFFCPETSLYMMCWRRWTGPPSYSDIQIYESDLFEVHMDKKRNELHI